MRRSKKHSGHRPTPPSGPRRELSPMEQWEQDVVRMLGLEDVAWDPQEDFDCCVAKREAQAEEAREAREEAARKTREATQRVLDELLMEQARNELEPKGREAGEREGREPDEDDPWSLHGGVLRSVPWEGNRNPVQAR